MKSSVDFSVHEVSLVISRIRNNQFDYLKRRKRNQFNLKCNHLQVNPNLMRLEMFQWQLHASISDAHSTFHAVQMFPNISNTLNFSIHFALCDVCCNGFSCCIWNHNKGVSKNYVMEKRMLNVCWTKTKWKTFTYLWVNLWPQIGHANGRSPVCDRICLVMWDDERNSLPQISHFFDRSLKCIFLCILNDAEWMNRLPHISHYIFNG